MKVEIGLIDGSIEVYKDAVFVNFLFPCKNPECPKEEFRTNDPRKEYCSYECQERAKYRRWQRK